MPNILLTGGAGFIGSHVAQALLRQGHNLAILDCFDSFYPPAWKRRNLEEVASSGKFTLFEGDIRDPGSVERAFAAFQPATVVHLAARAGIRPSIESPFLYEQVNVGGTFHLLEAARSHGVHGFVFGSSSSVYGEGPVPFREDNCALRPISPYAATKLAGESISYTYSHLYSMSVACLRFFTVYGPRQRPDLAIHKFTALIEKGQEVPVFGAGDTSRDYTYIDDIVAGVNAAVEWCGHGPPGRARHEILNLGNSIPVKLNDLLAAIEKATGLPARRKRLPLQAGDLPVTMADISKAGNLLGFQPSTQLEEGLAHFVAWYRQQPEDLRG
ncbi:MAG TPA: NAD-dependent epimerase/dehydratase family protein [Candidatus Saccharimonadales bacterium]|jgi:UDP-glucuronate 4-epimerase|nr:NAD-dependent epimerase/dehydratase family protein [Candidatus Saccharimonadales bacterium]